MCFFNAFRHDWISPKQFSARLIQSYRSQLLRSREICGHEDLSSIQDWCRMSSIQRDTPIQGIGRIKLLRQSSNCMSKSFVGAKILNLCGEGFAEKDAQRHQT